jgi:hypothetical protein
VKIDELERSLPNGFHDAALRSFSAVPEEQLAEFVIDISLGTPEDPPIERDRYRSARLVLRGMTYLAVDPPGPGASVWGSRGSMIDLVEADPAVSAQATAPANGFAARFFVSEWNAFIHFAAADAVLTWADGV